MKDKFPYGALHNRPATSAEIEKVKCKGANCSWCKGKDRVPCGRCDLIARWMKDGRPIIEQTLLHPFEIQGFSN